MNHSDFRIGIEFTCGDRRWRCTDVGTRTIAAIRIDEVSFSRSDGGVVSHQIINQDEAEAEGLFSGPSYFVAEQLFDEDDFEACEIV